MRHALAVLEVAFFELPGKCVVKFEEFYGDIMGYNMGNSMGISWDIIQSYGI